MIGHEGAIVSLASNSNYVASSSADLTVRLWTKHTALGEGESGGVGQQVRVVYGHVKSVLSLQIGESWMLTGAADFEVSYSTQIFQLFDHNIQVRVWTLQKSGKHSVSVDCTHRLQGHECPITCVKYGTLEVCELK